MSLRIVSFAVAGRLTPGVLTDDDAVVPLVPLLARRGIEISSVRQVLALWQQLAPLVRAELHTGDTRAVPMAEVQLGPPIPDPGQVIAVGFNYDTHTDGQSDLPQRAAPVVFMKSPTSISGPNDPVVRPAATRALDYEVEVAVAIGRPGYRIRSEQAADHIAGYMLANDITARDVALPHGFDSSPLQAQIIRGKGYPTFCPTGPWLLVPEADTADATFGFELSVNAELRQAGSTKDMALGFAQIIESVSATLALRTGDIILTGTPGGCGFQFDPPRYLQADDVVEARSQQLGTMRSIVCDEPADVFRR